MAHFQNRSVKGDNGQSYSYTRGRRRLRRTKECLGAFCVISGLADTIRGISDAEALEVAQYTTELLAAKQAAESSGSASAGDFWMETSAPQVRQI